ncbi:hypothetical protein EZV76_12310 [Flagellimonas alvinocaridis]|uniref:Uncharacterized protein n=1 Tax=Flagellimonas alvinocaridis TaxID=2530200 RepID=A0A4V4HWS1_9FLAO|nr:hypothetical protein [Allomuricauda alvinocaridis]THV58246.1 hypothetical protein EZV76_12310 [Allomuricauda alvinocaridis]
MTDKKLKYYERINSTFIGRKIIEVYYEELNYETDSEYWEYSTDIHSVDMNVIFRLDNDELIQIKWDNEFYCYGIGFEKLTELNKREGIKTISLTENANWKNLTDKTITEMIVLWDESFSQELHKVNDEFIPKGENKKITLPQTWQIAFGNQKIWISALEIKEDGTDSYWADHLTILFTNNGQEKYQLIKNASTQQCITAITADSTTSESTRNC